MANFDIGEPDDALQVIQNRYIRRRSRVKSSQAFTIAELDRAKNLDIVMHTQIVVYGH